MMENMFKRNKSIDGNENEEENKIKKKNRKYISVDLWLAFTISHCSSICQHFLFESFFYALSHIYKYKLYKNKRD